VKGAGRPPLTLGTAGHIDHGKTALIRALTGRDTDRLPEERERGISIELGYAPLVLPGGRRLSVVDVPGHERFVRTMVAGATGIDLFILCVAADDGVMPQTREHLAVLRHLGVEHGVVAITKADLMDPAPAAAEVAELLPGIEALPVSALAGEGLTELLAALDRVVAGLPGRAASGGPARLHVDRSFTLTGIGTVVTGTLWSGSLAPGDRVALLPSGREARVRSVEVHDTPVERAEAGQRVALALAGIGWREVSRGDVVCSLDADLEPTYLVDALIELEPGVRPLHRGTRVHVHHGTREAAARVAPLGPVRTDSDEPKATTQLQAGSPAFLQLRLEAPLVPARDDRLVLRQLAPPDTIGGGQVIDPQPRRHGARPDVLNRLQALHRGEAVSEPAAPPTEEAAAGGVATKSTAVLDEAALRLAELLRTDGATPRADGDLAAAVGLDPAEVAAHMRTLEEAGRAVRVGRNLHFDPDVLDQLIAQVVDICKREGSASLAGIRDELGTSRRYAQALLEHLDAEKVTIRRGDVHVLRNRSLG
jgi:selenocysteine-specific elongation factor